MVYGVKVDGADYPEWKDTALKNDYLRDAGLFATLQSLVTKMSPEHLHCWLIL